MGSFHYRLSLLIVAILALSMVAPSVNGTSPTYLTTAITQSGVKNATVGGYNGIIVNYTNTYSTSFSAFVYLDLVNSAGQTVSWRVVSCSFTANQLVQCFAPIPSVDKGNYTAWLFATTNTNVPVSASSSIRVTI